ncbi:hypothetical protein SAMN05216431_11038 [Ligilactobacillus sp. WC1T17]|uniref:DUF2929 family protein n=1 Tax=Ligilactobacillus ruminis TaxID=1623 RepID=A0ABY1ACR3_9LACO|nr:hypothetical protein SAMN05216431_11038 [Ligilactobacillus ruminis]
MKTQAWIIILMLIFAVSQFLVGLGFMNQYVAIVVELLSLGIFGVGLELLIHLKSKDLFNH